MLLAPLIFPPLWAANHWVRGINDAVVGVIVGVSLMIHQVSLRVRVVVRVRVVQRA